LFTKSIDKITILEIFKNKKIVKEKDKEYNRCQRQSSKLDLRSFETSENQNEK